MQSFCDAAALQLMALSSLGPALRYAGRCADAGQRSQYVGLRCHRRCVPKPKDGELEFDCVYHSAG